MAELSSPAILRLVPAAHTIMHMQHSAALARPPGSWATYDVVIPCHNRAHVIADAVESVLTQTIPPERVILVDDGSTDGGAEAVHRLAAADTRVTAMALPRNSGASAARNVGTAAARSGWIAFLDSDDMWVPDAAEALLRRAAVDDLDVIVGAFARVENGGPAGDPECGWAGDCIRAALRTGGVVGPSWSLVRRATVYAAGGFDPSFRNCNDWDFFVRAAAAGARFGRVPDLIALYRTVTGSRLVGDVAALEANGARVLAHPWLAKEALAA